MLTDPVLLDKAATAMLLSFIIGALCLGIGICIGWNLRK